MQDEVDEKCVSVTVTATRMTARLLADALKKAIAEMEAQRKGLAARNSQVYKGKVSMDKLIGKGGEISNIEITDKNIRSFEKYARKYNVTYSLKKDRSREPPRYMVFFKAKDISQMEAAFKEYTGWQMNTKKEKRPSVIKKLQEKVAIASKQVQKEKLKERVRDGAR